MRLLFQILDSLIQKVSLKGKRPAFLSTNCIFLAVLISLAGVVIVGAVGELLIASEFESGGQE